MKKSQHQIQNPKTSGSWSIKDGHLILNCKVSEFELPKFSKEDLQKLQSVKIEILNVIEDLQKEKAKYDVEITHHFYSPFDHFNTKIVLCTFVCVLTKNVVSYENQKGFIMIDEWRKPLDLFNSYLRNKMNLSRYIYLWVS